MNSHAAQDKPSAQELADLRARADAGEASAQFNLGWMYTEGRGVPQDDAEAIAWYRRAAEQGNADAQFNLGWMYANGRGRAAGLRRGHCLVPPIHRAGPRRRAGKPWGDVRRGSGRAAG